MEFVKKTTILNDFESKRSSYRCFQGQILASFSNGFVHALKYIFFSSNNFFFYFCAKENSLYTNLCNKKTG